MTGYFDLWPDFGDSPVRADQERHAVHAHVFLSKHGFLPPHTIGLEHGVAFVGAERDIEIMLGSEPIEGSDRVCGNAEDAGSGLFEGGSELRKLDGLLGAAGGVGLRIEIEDELASLEIGERHLAAVTVGQGEGRSLAAFGENHRHTPSFRRFQWVNLRIRSRFWAKAEGHPDMSDQNRIQVNQIGDDTSAGHTDKGMSDRA